MERGARRYSVFIALGLIKFLEMTELAKERISSVKKLGS
jgi:hypothetical protein